MARTIITITITTIIFRPVRRARWFVPQPKFPAKPTNYD